jgi:hypothetical protein
MTGDARGISVRRRSPCDLARVREPIRGSGGGRRRRTTRAVGGQCRRFFAATVAFHLCRPFLADAAIPVFYACRESDVKKKTHSTEGFYGIPR